LLHPPLCEGLNLDATRSLGTSKQCRYTHAHYKSSSRRVFFFLLFLYGGHVTRLHGLQHLLYWISVINVVQPLRAVPKKNVGGGGPDL